VITEAGNHPKVAGLAYIAAFAPDKGEFVATLNMRHQAQPCRRYCRRKTAICSRTRQSSPPLSRPTWTQRRQRSGPILKFRGAWRSAE
jgi:hypothetical protein